MNDKKIPKPRSAEELHLAALELMKKKHPHPCDHRGQEQRCKYRPGMVCGQNARNAPKNLCGHFKVRKVRV